MPWRVTVNPPEGSLVVLPNGRAYGEIYELDSVGDPLEDSMGDPIEDEHEVVLTDAEYYRINPDLISGGIITSATEVPILTDAGD